MDAARYASRAILKIVEAPYLIALPAGALRTDVDLTIRYSDERLMRYHRLPAGHRSAALSDRRPPRRPRRESNRHDAGSTPPLRNRPLGWIEGGSEALGQRRRAEDKPNFQAVQSFS